MENETEKLQEEKLKMVDGIITTTPELVKKIKVKYPDYLNTPVIDALQYLSQISK